MADTRFKITRELKERAEKLGFDGCRIAPAELPAETGNRLETFVANAQHGTMAWMETTLERRKSPQAMWPEARSAILLGMNYGPNEDPMHTLALHDLGTISVYARHRDYHDIIKGKLKELAGWLISRTGKEVKVFVDTAPVMEKPLAERAGLGWQGKHTNLVSREFGSWLFLGAILSAENLSPDEPNDNHCGSCSACLDVCPTNAFPAPYQLDARRCISYLTIEHAGPIPKEFREPMGNRIYGCDDCLAVCPWNKYARTTREAKLVARDDLKTPPLKEFAELDDAEFRKKFPGSPIKRIGRNRFLRNVMIAIGNSNTPSLRVSAANKLGEADPVVRGAAVWALSRLEDGDSFADMRESALVSERDKSVLQEWNDRG